MDLLLMNTNTEVKVYKKGTFMQTKLVTTATHCTEDEEGV
jgi:hypothetical protein